MTLGLDYSNKVDVYSFAIVMYIVLTDDFHPFGRLPRFNVEMRVANDPKFRPDTTKMEFQTIVTQAWDADPSSRMSFPELSMMLRTELEKLTRSVTLYLQKHGADDDDAVDVELYTRTFAALKDLIVHEFNVVPMKVFVRGKLITSDADVEQLRDDDILVLHLRAVHAVAKSEELQKLKRELSELKQTFRSQKKRIRALEMS